MLLTKEWIYTQYFCNRMGKRGHFHLPKAPSDSSLWLDHHGSLMLPYWRDMHYDSYVWHLIIQRSSPGENPALKVLMQTEISLPVCLQQGSRRPVWRPQNVPWNGKKHLRGSCFEVLAVRCWCPPLTSQMALGLPKIAGSAEGWSQRKYVFRNTYTKYKKFFAGAYLEED